MSRKLVIDPVTRIEGHGKVTIQLNDAKKVDWARLNVVEFRGYEKFVQGHPYWEAPMMLQRVCGICFVSHHLAGAVLANQLCQIPRRRAGAQNRFTQTKVLIDATGNHRTVAAAAGFDGQGQRVEMGVGIGQGFPVRAIG